MKIKCFVVGPILTNCYVVSCEQTREAIVIDPGFTNEGDGGEVLREIIKEDIKVKYIVITHGHFDHTSGIRILKKETGAKILIHEKDAELLPEPWKGISENISRGEQLKCPACGSSSVHFVVAADNKKASVKCDDCGMHIELASSPSADIMLKDGDKIEFGNYKFQVIHTPGHSKGGISLYCKEENALFSGDTLFAGAIGRTDIFYSSYEEIMDSLKNKLLTLPDDTVVYPGHGDATTIGKERRSNPYLV